jgi:pilus assembly protein CpaF
VDKEKEVRIDKSKWTLAEKDYELLWPYVCQNSITDIDFNGTHLWICDLEKGRYKTQELLSESFVDRFCQKVANSVSASFNRNHPEVEAETTGLRITVLHESVTQQGKVFCIRKTPMQQRLQKEAIVASGYASEATINLLANCVKSGLSIVICGGMGTGKTELIKYLTQYIPAGEKTITIEDTSELHFKKLHPHKDGIELLVDATFTFEDALKSCLRLNADRVILSETRSREVAYLMENVSSGVGCITSLHTDDVRNVPDRIKNMYPGNAGLEQVENDVYRFINVGVFLRKRQIPGERVRRYIEQVGFYTREANQNRVTMVMDEKKQIDVEIPWYIHSRMRIKNIIDPFAESDMWGSV